MAWVLFSSQIKTTSPIVSLLYATTPFNIVEVYFHFDLHNKAVFI
jgi:hypothetical protein